MYFTKPAAVGVQFLVAILLIAGLGLMLYVNTSSAAMFITALGLGVIILGHPRRSQSNSS